MLRKQPCVYILASKPNGTLYIGVTSDIVARMQQHKAGTVEGFTARYGIKILVHYETFPDMESAITREKQLKKWNRQWKIELIENTNQRWRDLYDELV
jgi:putative endonuclease